MDEETDWEDLPLEEKVQHNIWKVRLAGYEEAAQLFRTWDDKKSPQFANFADVLPDMVTDINAVAQLKGLEACQAFVANADLNQTTVQELVDALINGCFISHRDRTRDLSKEIIILCIEAGHWQIVEEELLSGLTHKNTRVVICCVTCLKEALRDFGKNIIEIKPIMKSLRLLMKHTSQGVRDETKQLILEMYRWTGPEFKQMLEAELPSAQTRRLEADFENISSEKRFEVRFLRSQRTQESLNVQMETNSANAQDPENDQSGIKTERKSDQCYSKDLEKENGHTNTKSEKESDQGYAKDLENAQTEIKFEKETDQGLHYLPFRQRNFWTHRRKQLHTSINQFNRKSENLQ